jgi:hypothetical protein
MAPPFWYSTTVIGFRGTAQPNASCQTSKNLSLELAKIGNAGCPGHRDDRPRVSNRARPRIESVAAHIVAERDSGRTTI